MKKGLALLIVLSLLTAFMVPQAAAVTHFDAIGNPPDLNASGEAASFDFEFSTPSDIWNTVVANDEPATFSKVTYEIADDVIAVGSDVSASIRTAGQLLGGLQLQQQTPGRIVASGGYVPVGILDSAAAAAGRTIEPGSVVVDESSGTAFKVVSPVSFSGLYAADETLMNSVKALDGNYAVTQPALNEVVKAFSLEEETIALTRGNISGFASAIESTIVNSSGYRLLANDGDFKYLPDDPLLSLQFAQTRLDADLGNGQSVRVTISGQIGIGSINLTGQYSGFDGYKIAMTLDQECDLYVSLDADISQEIRIPLFGIEASFGVGRIAGGVFAIIGLDGTLRLQIESETYTATTMGVSGGTMFYVPTSANPVFEQELKMDGDCSLAGDISGYIKVGPMVRMELFGFDLVGGGAFLGAGVDVDTIGHFLDIEVRGIFNVYVTLGGRTLNLANYKPLILQRKQADTAGFRIKILEAYIKPGRVGGLIETETDDASDPDGYVPAPGVQYRILVVPPNTTFNPDDPNSINQAAIRKYPSSGFASTNSEGEFIQKDETILYAGDRAYLEFLANDQSYYTDPVTAILPFEQVQLTSADYFNDTVTGTVQPVRLINWEASASDPAEQQYEWVYYDHAIVHVFPYHGNAGFETSGGEARCLTDAYGNFDTRQPFGAVQNQIEVQPAYQPEHEAYYLWTWCDVVLDHNQALTAVENLYINPTMSLTMNRVINTVEGSYQRYEEQDRIIDEILYDEFVWIINPAGTRTVTEAELDCEMFAFSTADAIYRYDDSALSSAVAAYTGNDKWSTPPIVMTQPGSIQLTKLLDQNGQETGSALLKQRVAVRWVWQAHPNPVTITSEDTIKMSGDGGSFQVTATGFAPFRFSLAGAPQGILIDAKTGLLSVPQGILAGAYKFVIRAEEDRSGQNLTVAGQPDPYQGNDPSEPDEQAFTLVVEALTATPTPTQTPESHPPVIDRSDLPTTLAMTSGDPPIILNLAASGTSPMTWSLEQSSPHDPLPSSVSIKELSGELTIKGNLEPGTYAFTVRVENEAGFDTQAFTLQMAARIAPVIDGREDDYQFRKMITHGTTTEQVSAAGSLPIVWSLQKYNPRENIPSQVSIDPNTGLLTFAAGLAKGTYYFTIRAENDVGYDLQNCTLTVLELSVMAGSDPFQPNGKLTGADPLGISRLAVSSGAGRDGLSVELPVVPDSLLNNLTNTQPSSILVCDHALDVYTQDRQSINGTNYIRWDSKITVSIEGVEYRQSVIDPIPVMDLYHYADPLNIPAGVRDQIEDLFREDLTVPVDDLFGDGQWNPDVFSELDAFAEGFSDLDVTFLDYGSLISDMISRGGGAFGVDLGGAAGGWVTGKLFQTLGSQDNARLSLTQPGLTMTFAGRDIGTSIGLENDLFDFSFSAGAPHATDMLAAVKPGSDNFTYGFSGHGPLPGMALFEVETGLAQGTRVNVYRYGADTGQFELIAGNVAVDRQGVAAYRNNTLSEYLITTDTLAGAQVSAVFELQDCTGSSWLLVLAAGLALLALAAGTTMLIRRSPKRNMPH